MIARAFALLVAGPFRFLVLAGAVACCIAVYLFLPSVSAHEGTPMGVAPSGSPAVRAEETAIANFGFPITSEIAIVQRNPNGLSAEAQRRVVDRAMKIDQGQEKRLYPGIVGAIPLLDTGGLLPGSREKGTTAVTLLQLDPRLGMYAQYQLARRYAREQVGAPGDDLVGITGAIPARALQGDLIDQTLPAVEFVSVAVIFILITTRFRAPGAGLVTLIAAGVAVFISDHIVAWAALRYGLSLPVELQPLLVVLVLAVATDYSVFLLNGTRNELANGERPPAASMSATAQFAPLILIAALTVGGATASLWVADLQFLRVLGPALGLSAVAAAIVVLAIVPALLSSFGRWIFWPGLRWTDVAVPAGASSSTDPGFMRRAIARLQSIRVLAFGLTGLAIAALLFASLGLKQLHTGISLLDDIPAGSAEARAAQAATAGFAPGVLSPTELIVQAPGIGGQRAALARLEEEVGREPGVAAVYGPREQVPGMPEGIFVSKSGDAARIAIVLDADPYSARAIDTMRRVDGDLPSLMREAGLAGAKPSVGGDTEAGVETIDALRASLIPVGLVIAAIEFVLMALLLQALIAPLYLLVASALSAAAPLGLMAWLFVRLGHPDISYYVPIGVAVLMVSLGADYNLFLVGRIWDALEKHSVGGAIRAAAPRASSSIATAALALSLSFATLALVPLTSFRAFAFAMAAGALIDSYLVRAQLVPALVSLFGRVGAWPGPAARSEPRRRYWVA